MPTTSIDRVGTPSETRSADALSAPVLGIAPPPQLGPLPEGEPPIPLGGPGDYPVVAGTNGDASEPNTTGYLRVFNPFGQTTTTSVTVFYTVGGTAVPGVDYVPLPGSVVIPAGTNSALIPVIPLDDALDEVTETVSMTIQSGGGYYVAQGGFSSQINLNDDDRAGGGTLGDPIGGDGNTGAAGGPDGSGPHEECSPTASFSVSTLDSNSGNVLVRDDSRPAYLGGAVDLRAQVLGPAGASYTYSWGTAGLTGRAGSITGANTSRLQFTWNASNSGDATTVSVPLTVTRAGGETVTQTYYFYVPKVSVAAPTTPVWPATLAPDQVRRDSYVFESYRVLVGAQTGALMTSFELPSYNPNVPPLAFEYDSLAADPQPIVVARHELSPSQAQPTKIGASLLLNGQSTATYYYDTRKTPAGVVVQIGVQNTNLPSTGRYPYTVTVAEDRSGTLSTVTYTGTTAVVNESASDFGAGWTLRGLDRLVTGLSGGVLLNVGQGDSLWFTGSGPTYTSPSGDYSTLTYDAATTTYTRALKGGERQVFDSNGRLSAWVDREGLRTTYSYTSGRLQTILDPYGNRTTFTYDGSNKLASVQDPASRRTTFTVSGGNLQAVQLPDASRVTYAYDASRRLTTLVNERSDATAIAYDSAGRVGTVTRPDGGVETFTAMQTRGWLAAGNNPTTPADPVPMAMARASRVNALGNSSAVRTDWTGKGLANQATDERCRVTTSNLRPDGALASSTDRRGRITRRELDARGNVLRVIDPSLAAESFTYTNDAYENVATHRDSVGATTTYSYDSRGNPSLIVDALGNRTTIAYAYTGDRVTSVAVTDARSNTTTFAYDSQERLTTVTYPGSGSPTTLIAYDSWGNSATVTDERGNSTTYAFDARNRITGVRDALGNRVTYSYDLAGNRIGVAAPLSRAVSLAYDKIDRLTTMVRQGTGTVLATTVYSYDADGNLASVADPDGRRTTHAYDSAGRLTTITDADGGNTVLAYDFDGNLATLTDARGHATTYGYDARGLLTRISAPLSRVTTFDRRPDGLVYRVAAPSSRTTTLGYDLLGRLATSIDPTGATTSFAYDAVGNLATLTNARGFQTQFAYDARDRLTTITAPLSRTTTLAYDAAGNLVGSTDPLGRRTTLAYDVLNRATTITDPLVRDTVVRFDAAGRATTLVNANGETVVLAYDAADRVTTVVRQGTGTALATTTYAYGPGDDLITEVDPNGNRTTFVYDPLHRLTTIQAPLGRTTTLAYDRANNLTGRTDANGNRVTYAYDAANRLTTITAPLSRVATRTYDAADRLAASTDPNGLTTTYQYDAADRLTTLTNPRGDTTRFAYDAGGNLVALADPNGNRTTYLYDAADRVTTMTDALGTATYAYDAGDQLTDKTDRMGRRTTFAYDAGGRRTGERWFAGASIVRTLTYSYDFVGRVTGATDASATLTFAYDSAGRLDTAVTSGPGTGQATVTLTYAYDAGDRRTGLVDGFASVGRTTYQYDAADRLTTLTRSHGGVAGPQVVLGYDPGDRLTSIGRTVGGTGTDVRTTMAYDAADRLTTLQHGRVVSGTPTPLATHVYAYDAGDRLTTETINGSAVTYTYDNAGQLTAAGGARVESYGYDSGGNRNTADHTNVAGNLQTASPGVTYTYDAEGNLTARTQLNGVGTSDDVVTTYAYDRRNRLTGVTRRSPGGAGAAVAWQATYTYDALDRRIGAEVDADGAGGGAATRRWTAYDGSNPYADLDGSGAVTNRYLHGPAVDFLLSRTSGSGTTAWYLPDRLGSIRNVADTAGSLTYTATYDSFGRVLSESGAGGDRFKYTGREYEAGAALYDYRARAYDPATGRFLQRDPIGFAAGDANLHRYVGNQPTGFVDPMGLDWLDAAANFSAGWGDTLSFGATDWVRDQAGWNGGIDHTSGMYQSGVVVGVAHGMALGYGAPANAANATRTARIASNVVNTYTVTGDAVGAYQSTSALVRGEFQSSDALGFAPVAGQALRQMGRAVDDLRRGLRGIPEDRLDDAARALDNEVPRGSTSGADQTPTRVTDPGGTAGQWEAQRGDVARAEKVAISKTYKRPSGYRKGIREQVWDRAKEADGKVRDPQSGREMRFDEPWDMGHKPGYEFRKHQQSAIERGIDRKRFLDEHNNPDHYRPELPSSNRSHAGEDKTGSYFGY